MGGHFVSIPGPVHSCAYPESTDYPHATVWECDDCQGRWVLVYGAQYNEVYRAWRPLTADNRNGVDH